MLKRKIESRLTEWKNTQGRKPLIIKGCRQCGKTFSVLDFARKNYTHVVYLNFFENPDYASVFPYPPNHPRGLNKRSKSGKLNPKGSEEVLRPDWSWLEWIR